MSFAEEQLSQLFAEKSRQERFSGAVLISRNGEPLFRQAYGYANRSWKVENRVNTRFRIASISKMFMAVAILQLIDEGEITLDMSVMDCLAFWNTQIPQKATVYHMLTMTSGIADWFDESGDWEQEWAALCCKHPIYLFRQNEDYLPLFINKSSLTAVGEKHQYNGASYILLGLIIERLSGISCFDYVRQHIFAKANMSHSDFVALDGVQDKVAEGYIPITDQDENIIGWKKNIYATTPEAAADGGATSTVTDLVKFSQALSLFFAPYQSNRETK